MVAKGAVPGWRTDEEIKELEVAQAQQAFIRELQAMEYMAIHGSLPRSGPRWGKVVLGGLIALVALGVSMGSYEQAASGGGTYFIFWGAVLWGGWIALKGLAGE
jgi:hypothetical protein